MLNNPHAGGRLGRSSIKHIIAAARLAFQQEDVGKALQALQPLVDDIGATVAACVGTPLDDNETWHENAYKFIDAWRKAISAWRDDDFRGLEPGPRAIVSVARDMLNHAPPLIQDRQAWYRGKPASAFLRSISAQVFDRAQDAEQLLLEAAEAEARIAVLDAVAMLQPPANLFAECVWIPGWDGESLDDAIDTLCINVQRRGAIPSTALVADQGLSALLHWVNVSPTQLARAVRQKHGEAFATATEAALKKLRYHPDPRVIRQQVVTPENLVQLIDNGQYTCAIPVVYAEVNLRALFQLDPRQTIMLTLNNGKGFAAGLHDFVNGAGYVDTWPGTVWIAPMSTGVISGGRYGHGIASTYDMVRSYFRCTPRNMPELAAAA